MSSGQRPQPLPREEWTEVERAIVDTVTAAGQLDDVARSPAAIASALARMLGYQGLPEEVEAEIVGRAFAALALSSIAPDAYVANVLRTLRREMIAELAGEAPSPPR